MDLHNLMGTVTVNGNMIVDSFNSKTLFISGYLEEYKILNTSRIDLIAQEIFQDDYIEYWWMIMFINKNMNNPLALKYNLSQEYISFKKTLLYNPVKFVKEETMKLMKVINNTTIYELIEIIIKIQDKSSFLPNEFFVPLNDYKVYLNDYLFNVNFITKVNSLEEDYFEIKMLLRYLYKWTTVLA